MNSDTSLPMSERYDRLTEFLSGHRQISNAYTLGIDYQGNRLTVALCDDGQQVLCTSENVDSPKPFSDSMQESLNEPQNAEELRLLEAINVNKGGTVDIMHGNSALMFQLTFLANAGLLPSSLSTGGNLSLPGWMTEEGTFSWYHDGNMSNLFNESIFFLVNKHNLNVLAVKFFFENYEMVKKGTVSFAINIAGNSEKTLSNKDREATINIFLSWHHRKSGESRRKQQ